MEHGHTGRMLTTAAALITLLATAARPLAAQEVIELPAEDRFLDADFEEVYRVGSLDSGGWDMFGNVAGLGFDGAGNLYIPRHTGDADSGGRSGGQSGAAVHRGGGRSR